MKKLKTVNANKEKKEGTRLPAKKSKSRGNPKNEVPVKLNEDEDGDELKDEDDDEISEAIAEEDDEEIDEDEAFNSEDERKWGAIFPKSKSSSSTSSSSRVTSSSSRVTTLTRKKNIRDNDEEEEEEEQEEEEEEDTGLTLEDMLDASLAADAAKKAAKNKNSNQSAKEQVTLSSSSSKGSKRQRDSLHNSLENEEEEDEEDDEKDGDGGFLSDEQRLKILELLNPTGSSSRTAIKGDKGGDESKKKIHENDKSKNKNKKRLIESGGMGPEGEFTAAHSEAVKAAKGLLKDADSGGVDIGSLVSSLAGTAGFSSLKSRLEKLVGQTLDTSSSSSTTHSLIPLKAPPSKEVAEKATRAESYDHVSRLVGNKWTDLVALTRQAPTVSYSAEAGLDTRKTQTTASMAASFTPSNEFEVKIAAALAASGMGALPGQSVQGALSSSSMIGGNKRRRNTAATGDKAVLESEQSELAALGSRLGGDDDHEDDDDDDDGFFEGDDLAEAPPDAAGMKARQKTLQRMRALLFFDEIKKRRINKVKSKTFRRLRKKADARAGANEIERLQEEDPEAAKALEDAEARIIAKERASLKHRSSGRGVGGSKWIKRVLARGGGSGPSDAHLHNKADLIAFQQREEALRAKIRGLKEGQEEDDDDDDDDNEEEGDDDNATAADIIARGRASILKIAHEDEEGGNGKPRKGLFGMRFMSQAVERAKAAARESGEAEAAVLTRHESILRGGGVGGGKANDWTLGNEDDYDADAALKEEDEAIAEDDDQNDDDFAAVGNISSENALLRKKPESALSKLRRERAEKIAKADAASSNLNSSSATATGRFSFKGRSDRIDDDDDDDEEERREVEGNRSNTSKSLSQKGMSAVRAIAAVSSNPNFATKSGVLSSSSTSTLSTVVAAAAPPLTVDNPWLASSFSSGLGSRHNASKRASTAAAEASKNGTNASSVIDVVSTISAIQDDVAKKTKGRTTTLSSETSEKEKKKGTKRSSNNEESQTESPVLEKNKRAKVMTNDNAKVVAPHQRKKNGDDDDKEEEEEEYYDNDEEDENGPVLRRMDQASLVRAAFVDAGADASVEDTIEADKLREEREKAQDDAVANKRGRAGRGGKDKTEASAKGWGSWTGLGASTITKSNPLRGERGAGEKSHSSSATVTPSASASLILANKKAEIIAAEEAKESETPAQKAARIELKRRKDAGLSGVFISEKRDRKLAMAHQAPNVPHPFSSKEAYEASMRHPLGREWNTMVSTAALTRPEWTTKAGLIIQPIKPGKIVRNGKGPEEARKHIPSIGGVGKGERNNKKR
jgi:U3 small nucleolar RNA-associated protein 14